MRWFGVSHEDGTCECHVSPGALARALARKDALQLARLDGTAALKSKELPAGAAAAAGRMRAREPKPEPVVLPMRGDRWGRRA